VTLSGDYLMADGTFRRFTWRGGRLQDDGAVPGVLDAATLALLDEQAATMRAYEGDAS
jgi:hypothetical protein